MLFLAIGVTILLVFIILKVFGREDEDAKSRERAVRLEDARLAAEDSRRQYEQQLEKDRSDS